MNDILVVIILFEALTVGVMIYWLMRTGIKIDSLRSQVERQQHHIQSQQSLLESAESELITYRKSVRPTETIKHIEGEQ